MEPIELYEITHSDGSHICTSWLSQTDIERLQLRENGYYAVPIVITEVPDWVGKCNTYEARYVMDTVFVMPESKLEVES